MSPNTVKTLGAVTILFSAGAWYANNSRASGGGSAGAGDFAVPALQERINDVASVVVETKDGKATLERVDAQWTLAEKGGYPAKEAKVREVLMALRGAEIVEQKTSDPEKFSKLGLDEPNGGDSKGKRITIQDAAGADIASVLIGDRRPSKAGFSPGRTRSKGQTYIHTTEGAPALLVDQEFTLDARTGTWLDQQIVNVPATRIRAVRIAHPGGEQLELYRKDMAEADFEILNVPEGMEPKSPSATRTFMSTLTGLRFDDVKKADAFDWTGEEVVTTEFFTEHGLRVTIKSIEVTDEGGNENPTTWCTVAVDAVDPSLLPGAPPEQPEPGPPAPETAPEETEGDGVPVADSTPLEKVEREAASMHGTVADWAFALPRWKSGSIRMLPSGVLQETPEAEPDGEEEPDPEDPEGSKDDE